MEKDGFVVLYESPRGRCSAEYLNGKVWLHVRIHEWGMDTMRELRAQWPEVRAKLRALGYTALYAYNYEKDADQTWQRFMKFLGFRELGRGKGLVVMGVKNA